MKKVFKKMILSNPEKRRLFTTPFSYTPQAKGFLDTREALNSCSTGGRIELIIGPMFAGKTTELMRRLRRETYARRSCFMIKYSKDTRYSTDSMASHDRVFLKANAAVHSLADVGDEWQSFDIIGIDEGQFFPDLLSFATKAADAGKTVIISALDGDYRREPFGHVCDIIPHCESVDKLTAVCMICHDRPGTFTRRTMTGNSEQEVIGGAEMYVSTCRTCFAAETNASNPADKASRN